MNTKVFGKRALIFILPIVLLSQFIFILIQANTIRHLRNVNDKQNIEIDRIKSDNDKLIKQLSGRIIFDEMGKEQKLKDEAEMLNIRNGFKHNKNIIK